MAEATREFSSIDKGGPLGGHAVAFEGFSEFDAFAVCDLAVQVAAQHIVREQASVADGVRRLMAACVGADACLLVHGLYFHWVFFALGVVDAAGVAALRP